MMDRVRMTIFNRPSGCRPNGLAMMGTVGCLLWLSAVAGARPGLMVSASSAPLRDAPSADAQVLGRVPRGYVLSVTGRSGADWLEIQSPDQVTGWVHGELVRNGHISATSVKVRSGPGVGYGSLAELKRGTPVQILDRRGDWIQIPAHPSFRVWIERAMVAEEAAVDLRASLPPPPVRAPRPEPANDSRTAPSVAAAAAPKPPASRPQQPSPVARVSAYPSPSPRPDASRTAGRTASTTPRPSPPPAQRPPVHRPSPPLVSRPMVPQASPVLDNGLIAKASQGEPVSISGIVRPVGLIFFALSDFRLVVADGCGPGRTLCYLAGNPHDLRARMGQTVTIEGRKYWAHGKPEPIVLVYAIR